MSRVKIVIDDVEWGLNISPEHTIDLIQALNGVAVAARREGKTLPLLDARIAAQVAFDNVLNEITFAARKSA